MAKILLNEQDMQYAVYGGAVLGGGGGGWIEDGLQIGRLALEVGMPELYTIDELAEEDLLAVVALVGAPGARDRFVKPVYHIKALELLSSKVPVPIKGITTNENGAGTTVNGWFQAAISGLPVIDCPCNGRAHPTGLMGSLNLSEDADYVSYQAAVGGKAYRYIELCVSGAMDRAAAMVRKASEEAGGLVAVARNPVKAGYAKENGAPGGVQHAMAVGEAFLAHRGEAAVAAVVDKLGGKVVVTGRITQFSLETAGGFDVGKVLIEDQYELTFWNEYMTLEHNGERIATFPDLIMTLDAKTARPLISAAIKQGQDVAVIMAPKENLLLGTTMKNKKLLQPIETITGKQILTFACPE